MMDHVTTLTLLNLVLTLGAVARITRLVNKDVLLDKPRAALLKRLVDKGHTQVAYLLICPWCLSMYLGVAGSAAWAAWGSYKVYTCVALVFTVSYVTGWLGSKESE